jgi:hypothetical protein
LTAACATGRTGRRHLGRRTDGRNACMPPSEQEDEAPRALRLTFTYAEGRIELVDRRPIRKRVPSPDAPAGALGDALLVQVRDEEGEAVFNRVVVEAIPRDIEVFDPDLPGGLARAAVERPSGVFNVLVPDDEKAAEVVLMSSRESHEADEATGMSEIARFDLRGEIA